MRLVVPDGNRMLQLSVILTFEFRPLSCLSKSLCKIDATVVQTDKFWTETAIEVDIVVGSTVGDDVADGVEVAVGICASVDVGVGVGKVVVIIVNVGDTECVGADVKVVVAITVIVSIGVDEADTVDVGVDVGVGVGVEVGVKNVSLSAKTSLRSPGMLVFENPIPPNMIGSVPLVFQKTDPDRPPGETLGLVLFKNPYTESANTFWLPLIHAH